MTTDHPNPSKPRRRWFQFSLRTLLVLVTVLCVCQAVTANRARKQREAVEIETTVKTIVTNDAKTTCLEMSIGQPFAHLG